MFLPGIYCAEFVSSLKQIGPKRTFQHVIGTVRDVAFDVKHGTSTSLWEPLEGLFIESANKPRGVDYHPTRVRAFRMLMSTLNLPRQGTFVDLGCGKGRALLLAMEYGFKNVVGIEFSERLCGIAKKNISAFQRKTSYTAEANVIHGDVVDYRVNDDDTVFYLFNPFDGFVLEKAVQNIRRSVDARPRTIWLIYNNPLQSVGTEHESTFLEGSVEYEFDQCRFRVYESRSNG